MTQAEFIISRAKSSLPPHLVHAPWSIVGHGTRLLSTEDELNAYLVAYGEMHRVKCNAAMQNFPYELLPTRIHLIDWGCGQGLGALCFLDNLYARGLINRVKKITLIEPSQAALEKAGKNLRTAMENYSPEIETIQCYLPAEPNGASTLTALNINLPGTVHVFSNILDIPSVNLRRTAQIIEGGQGIHFVLCTSPVNDNARRLDEFAQYFTQTDVFSDICDRDYGYTSDTFHKFGCKTKCFFFSSADSTVVSDVKEGIYTESGAYGDYDLRAMVNNGYLSSNLYQAYSSLASHLGENDRIFLKPNLNGDTPDIIVVRPKKGILVFNIFEEDLNKCYFDNGSFTINGQSAASPLSRAFGYRDNIIEQHSTEILRKTVTDRSAWFIVRPAVWFPQGNRTQINSLFAHLRKPNGITPNNSIAGVLTLASDEINSDNIWDSLDMNRVRRSFSDQACNQFINVLRSQWHCYTEGDNEIRLTEKQRQLARSFAGRVMRVKGVAGSGKTQVLASTAVNCQLRTGRRVLILTYNITLVNYIRYRIERIPADFPWNKFLITNYHNFFTTQAKNHDLKLTLASYDDANFFSSVRDELPKFSAILIDEAQDYESVWFKIIFNSFLEEDGEVVIFGDDKQDVYRRGSFETIPSVRNHTWGAWNKLSVGHRVNNQLIVDLAKDFQQYYFNEIDTGLEVRELTFTGGIKYRYASPNYPSSDIVDLIIKYINTEGVNIENTAILSQTTDVLRGIEYAYRKRTGISCMTTFETKEVFDALIEHYQGINSRFQEDLEKIRANKKAHFTMASTGIKMSTIYSYKGWEAACVVLIILPEPGPYDALENRPELIYTAITRAKDNLLIINLSNTTYHNFFQTHISDGIY